MTMSQTPLRLAFRAAQPLRRQQDPAVYFRACRAISITSTQRAAVQSPPAADFVSRRGSNRCFSSSSASQATIVLRNPRVDDDGKDMTIEISERAAKRLRMITSAPPQKNTLVASSSPSQDSRLRVIVTSGGCHGFQYLMNLEDASKLDEEEDTIFAADENTGSGKAEVVMDLPSLELLKGSTVDYTTELIGSQFKIVGNPRATSSCGCGTSFDVE